MKAFLSHPYPGSTDVRPDVEVSVTFVDVPHRNYDDVNIKIASVWAVKNGEIQKGFRTTHRHHSGDIMGWSVRSVTGLPPKDILVQAWCGLDRCTIEQRFYVRGAKVDFSHNIPTNHNWCKVPGGVLTCKKPSVPFKTGIKVNPNGTIENSLGLKFFIKPQWLGDEFHAYEHKRGLWTIVGLSKSRVYITGVNKFNKYEFGALAAKITDDFINLVVSENESLHLPLHYEPRIDDRYMSHWFRFHHDGNWNIEFFEDKHIWWNKEKLIAKHDINPIAEYAYDMLWTSEDLGEPIRSIENLCEDYILVNDHLRINTRNPSIEYV